jgi:hypothetical protein
MWLPMLLLLLHCGVTHTIPTSCERRIGQPRAISNSQSMGPTRGTIVVRVIRSLIMPSLLSISKLQFALQYTGVLVTRLHSVVCGSACPLPNVTNELIKLLAPIYPSYTPSDSFSSTYSTSSSASRAQSSINQRPILPPRSNSTASVAATESRGEPKSALKRDSTWGGSSSNKSGSHRT